MKLRFAAIACATVASISACSSPTTASKANFETAINAHLGKACSLLPISPLFLLGVKFSDHSYPIFVELPGESKQSVYSGMVDSSKKDQLKLFDILVSAGALTSKPTTAKFGFDNTVTNGREYSLTQVGKASLATPGKMSLCVGSRKVNEILQFTKPGDGGGQTVSEVSYTYTIGNVPAWARDKDLLAMMPSLAKMLEPNRPANDDLVLMNDGWRDSGSSL